MAKSYVDIVKYMIEARFEVSGMVDKPDIIGAIFGQTEGLLGGDLDLRELQKNGKIGRIEIESGTSESKTYGKLSLPTSLNRVETCILASAIESVDRVGPFETSFKIEKVVDTRSEKRAKIISRAKDLLKTLLETELPDSKELSELVESDVKLSEITTYGPEKLPAGPDIDKSTELILVEGRADVVNLLRNDITNCIAVGGASGTVPQTIIALCNTKDVTLFVDGDRGGELIMRSVMNVAEIDFLARAPDGKEVEELTRKEIIKALRSRIPIEQVVSRNGRQASHAQAPHFAEQQRHEREEVQQTFSSPSQAGMQQRNQFGARQQHSFAQQPQQAQQTQSAPQQARQAPYAQRGDEHVPSPSEIRDNLFSHNRQGNEGEGRRERPSNSFSPSNRSLGIKDLSENENGEEDRAATGMGSLPSIQMSPEVSISVSEVLISALDELKNRLRGRLYDSKNSMIVEKPISELIQAVQDTPDVNAIVFDGIITQRLVELAHRKGVKMIYGTRASQLSRKYDDMLLYTRESGKL
ncbi:MAG: DNA primase DnaG [Candidatus Micrarchaeia archaeon]